MIYRTQSHAIYLTITLNTGSKDNTSRSQRKTRLYRSWRLGSLLEHLTTTATRESLMAVNILRLLSSSMHRPHGSSCIFPCILHASFMHLMSQHSPHPSRGSSVGSSRSPVRRGRPLGVPLKSAEEARAIACVVLGIIDYTGWAQVHDAPDGVS